MDIPLLCAVCFSKDRILYLVTNDEFDLFNTLSPEIHEFIQTVQRSPSLKVCFECRGRLRGLRKFMEMVQQSLQTLIKCCSSTVTIPLMCSSKLALSETEIESFLPTMEVEVENVSCIVKVEATEHEEFDTPLNSITDITENVCNDTENDNFHNTEKVYSVPLFSGVSETAMEEDESMYFDASNSVKVEMNCEEEDNDVDSAEMGDDYGETYDSGSSLMQTKTFNSEDQINSEDLPEGMKKKRFPKQQMWTQTDIVWLSTEQARKCYMSELEQENVPGHNELCHQCRRSFKTKEDLGLHVSSHHEALGATGECDICEYKFTKPIHLHRHVRDHYLLYKCKMCDYETRHLHEMKIHASEHEMPTTGRRTKKIVYPKGYPHRCNKCKNFFGTKQQLQEHSKQYGCYPTSSICDVCLKLFKNRDKYIHGCRTECVDCHQTFKSLYFKRLHDCPYKVNEERKQFFCRDCDKEFKSRNSYHQHLTISRKHNRPKEKFQHECSHCERQFNTLAHLRRHITDMHLRRDAFKCPKCPKSFAESGQLSRHESRYHDARFVAVKDKICPVCGKAFEMQCYLSNHMRTHTEERPFECDICGGRFKQESTLRSHNRIKHLNQKSRLKPRKTSKKQKLPLDTAVQDGRDIVSHFMTCGVSELSHGETQMDEIIA